MVNKDLVIIPADTFEHVLDFADFMSLHVQKNSPIVFKRWVQLKRKYDLSQYRESFENK